MVIHPNLPPAVEGAVRAFRRAMEARFGGRLRDVRLFGSYARGDYHTESDVDVLTVVDELTRAERREIFEAAADLYDQFRHRVSPFAVSVTEYQTLREREYRIAAEIARDGVAL